MGNSPPAAAKAEVNTQRGMLCCAWEYLFSSIGVVVCGLTIPLLLQALRDQAICIDV